MAGRFSEVGVTDLGTMSGVAPTVDRVGSVASALLLGYLNNALRMYESGYASREDIDAAMRLGTGHPLGPLALLDLVGLDSAQEILHTLYAQSRDHRHAPAPVLAQYVAAGRLGRKSGRGIYTYAAPDSPALVSEDATPDPRLATPRMVKRIGVVGAGTMASGIVEVCARSGYDVRFRARGEDQVACGQHKIEGSLGRSVHRGRLTERDRASALSRITGTTSLDDLADCDLVIEAVVEDLAVKTALFSALDDVSKPGAVLATTTSSLPVTACAQATSRPGDVVGMHWFNPAPVMKLVEVVSTGTTADDVVATIRSVCDTLGKHPVGCGDRAGFIVNALLFPYLNEAVKMLVAHGVTVDDIDVAMTEGCHHPMGPFALMDTVGLDVTLAIQRTLFDASGDPGDAPAPMLEHLVRDGYLGRKSSRGFRDHSRP